MQIRDLIAELQRHPEDAEVALRIERQDVSQLFRVIGEVDGEHTIYEHGHCDAAFMSLDKVERLGGPMRFRVALVPSAQD